MKTTNVAERLFTLSDEKYADFMSALLPTVKRERIIGVRIPDVRKLAKEIKKSIDYESFLSDLPHAYYDEDAVHAVLLSEIKGERLISELERFLPFVDSWGICDAIRPSAEDLSLDILYQWLDSDKVYTKRFAIEMLMLHYLDDKFETEMFDRVAAIRSEEYYLNMMVAWYFATALAKRYEDALPYLTWHKLSAWTHNKTISKAIESHRIPPEKKEHLKSLRLKTKPNGK